MRTMVVALVAALMAGAVAGCLGGSGISADHAMVDATGVLVSLDDTSRLVASSHDLVEILYLLGMEDRLIGVPAWLESSRGNTHFPYDLGDKARLGRPTVLDAEEVIALGPSLVLEKDHPLQPSPLAIKLRAAGIPVFVFDNSETLKNIHETILTVGAILSQVDPDAPARAQALSRQLVNETADLERIVESATTPRLRALYQLPAGIVAGHGTSADLLLRMAGAINVAAVAGLAGYQQVSRETIVEADPERVVASATAAGSARTFFGNPRYAESTAARLGPETLRIVDPRPTSLVGPSFIAGVRDVAQWLHPAAFGLILLDDNVTETGTEAGVQIDVRLSPTHVESPPLRYRFDPGDGSAPWEPENSSFSYEYTARGSHLARVFAIDAQGRIDTIHHLVHVRDST